MSFNRNFGAKLPEVGKPFHFPVAGALKKLRRVPHIFSRVLELPFRSNADVSVLEDPDCFKFALLTDDIAGDVEARFVEIVAGISKIVICGQKSVEPAFDELELDVWRFRLPASTMPELATAAYTEGRLIVTVPKSRDSTEDSGVEEAAVGESHPRTAKIHGDYGSGVLLADGLANREELAGKLSVGRSNASRIQRLVPVQ